MHHWQITYEQDGRRTVQKYGSLEEAFCSLEKMIKDFPSLPASIELVLVRENVKTGGYTADESMS